MTAHLVENNFERKFSVWLIKIKKCAILRPIKMYAPIRSSSISRIAHSNDND